MRFMCLVLALAALCLVTAPAQSQSTSKDFSFVDAIEKGQEMVGGGTLLMARVERKNGSVAYGMYFLIKNYVMEIEISTHARVIKSKTGGGIPRDGTGPEDAVNPALLEAIAKRKGAKMPYARFFELAKDKVGGNPVGVELQLNQDKLQMKVDMEDGGNKSSVIIDVTDGKIVKGK